MSVLLFFIQVLHVCLAVEDTARWTFEQGEPLHLPSDRAPMSTRPSLTLPP